MPATVPDTAFGTTIAWTTQTQLNALPVYDLNWNPEGRTKIDTSAFGTAAVGSDEIGNATGILPDIWDPGSVEVVVPFNPDIDLPMAGDTITITWPDAGTWAFTGGLLNTPTVMPLRDKMVMTLQIAILSKITQVDAV